MSIAGFGYAQARIQARHGERPDEALWRRLHASQELGHFLESARASSLRPWVGHLTARQSAREIERSLRADFLEYVHEVAAWVPDPWQRAVGWAKRLPLLATSGDGFDPARELEEFRALWPACSRHERRGLDVLVELFSAHRRALERASSESDGWVLSARLEKKLAKLFRQRPQEPVTPFCHLGLTALDLARLRGALVRRAVLADVESEVAWV